MENITGYARVLARIHVERELNKPFFGKPYIKLGQCLGLWGYFFQVSGILAAKYINHLDEFGNAFLGIAGKPGAIKLFFNEVAENTNRNFLTDTTTFHEYISKEFLSRINSNENEADFFLANGMQKFQQKKAEELAWQYAEQGSSIGVTYPSLFRKMFLKTYEIIPKEKWDLSRKFGLNITPEQPNVNYEDSEDYENKLFLEYCKECCPKLFSILSMVQ